MSTEKISFNKNAMIIKVESVNSSNIRYRTWTEILNKYEATRPHVFFRGTGGNENGECTFDRLIPGHIYVVECERDDQLVWRWVKAVDVTETLYDLHKIV